MTAYNWYSRYRKRTPSMAKTMRALVFITIK